MHRRTEVLHPDLPGATLNLAPEQEYPAKAGQGEKFTTEPRLEAHTNNARLRRKNKNPALRLGQVRDALY